MTLQTGKASERAAAPHSAGVSPASSPGFTPGAVAAFTLIEMIVVMALLGITISVALPSLKGFFRGRTLDSEARRMLALTRQGQTRAVSTGVPMILWFDAAQQTLGLEAEAGYADSDPKAVSLQASGDLQFKVISLGTAQVRPTSTSNPHQNLPQIRFLPDGTLDESSPTAVQLTDRDGVSVFVAKSRSRLDYEIREQP